MEKRVVGSMYTQEELNGMWEDYDFALKQELIVASWRKDSMTPAQKGQNTKEVNHWKEKARELRYRMSPFGQLGYDLCATTNVEFEPRVSKDFDVSYIGTLKAIHFGTSVQTSHIEIPSHKRFGFVSTFAQTCAPNLPELSVTRERMVQAIPVAEFELGKINKNVTGVLFSGTDEGYALVDKQYLNEILYEFESLYGSRDWSFYIPQQTRNFQMIAIAQENYVFALCMSLFKSEFELQRLYRSYVLKLRLENGDTSLYSESETEETPPVWLCENTYSDYTKTE